MTLRAPLSNVSYVNKDYESFRRMMIEQLEITMPEYTDKSSSDAGIVILELLAKGLDILSFYQDVQANEMFLATEEQRENALKWCSLLDYTPRGNIPSKIRQAFILDSKYGDDTIIPAGTKIKTVESSVEPAIMFETLEDLVIPAGYRNSESEGYPYTVEAVQGYTVNNEIVGSSNGLPDQKFKLNYSPVIETSIAVLVNEGGGFHPWKRVSTFLDSESGDNHFKVETNDRDETFIIFGNGITGKIPSAFSEGILVTYRVGGGIIGNVGAGVVNVLDSSIPRVWATLNPNEPFELGYDKESLEEIKRNAPIAYRDRWACLTEEDYGERVKQVFPQILLAKSVKRTAVGEIDNIDVYMLPDTYPNPPSQELQDEIQEMLDDRALVGTHAIMNFAREHNEVLPLDGLEITLVIRDTYSRAEVKSLITNMLLDYFAIGNYDFGKECSISDLESLIWENFGYCIKLVRVSFDNLRNQDVSSWVSSNGYIIQTPKNVILTLNNGSYIGFNITGGTA